MTNREKLIAAIEIMDRYGRSESEHHSIMLWKSKWKELRALLLECVDEVVGYPTCCDVLDESTEKITLNCSGCSSQMMLSTPGILFVTKCPNCEEIK